MRYRILAPLVSMLLLIVAPVQAHHSFAMFDKTKLVTVKGVVHKLEWGNPHVFIFLDVTDAKGKKAQYAVECNSPNVLMRTGWKPGTVKAGETISISLYPLRDGRPGGLLDSVTLANGKTMKG